MTWTDTMIRPAAAMYQAEPPPPIPVSVTYGDPLRRGRLIDIVAALSRGEVMRARCLIANSPGLDWRAACSASLRALVEDGG